MFISSFMFRGVPVLYAEGVWDCDDGVVLRQVVQQAATAATAYSPAHGSREAYIFDNVFRVFKKAGATDRIRSKVVPDKLPPGTIY